MITRLDFIRPSVYENHLKNTSRDFEIHSLKDIAFQAGVSLATVDRVLHGRSGVRVATKTRVEAAIRELDRQSASVLTDGKRIAIDIILEAPDRFSKAVRAAFEAELEGLRPASMRLRFHISESFDQRDLELLMQNILRRGTHGIVAKLPDRPEIVEHIAKFVQARIPVVTFVTDLPASDRLAYIGMDNFVAGRMAAFLMSKFRIDGDILAVLSSKDFEGEAARLDGFHTGLGTQSVHVVHGAMGRDAQTQQMMRELLERGVHIGAVYSAGGANPAVLRALERAGQKPQTYIAHDLDGDNRTLLKSGKIDFVIYHELRQDARSCCQHILQALRLLPPEFKVAKSAIQLATPLNIPS